MKKERVNQCIDKQAIEQVLGSLMNKPSLIDTEDINLDSTDFVESFYTIIFNAIMELYKNKAETITPDVVEERILSSNGVDGSNAKKFIEENGKDYLLGAYRRAEPTNFQYYYDVVKKFTLLRTLAENGFSILEFFKLSETDPEKIQERKDYLDSCSIENIINHYKDKMLIIGNTFAPKVKGEKIKAGEGMIGNIEKWKTGKLYGIPYASEFFTEVTHGLNKGRFTLLSAGTGVGKTRLSIANICHSFVPFFYNSESHQWEKNPYVSIVNGKAEVGVLYIGTEMDLETEVNPILSAYIADVEQNHIMEGKYEPGEEERVKLASILIERYSKIYLENQPEYSVEKIETIIASYSKEKNVKYIFLDYIYANTELIKEYTIKSKSNISIREDQVLLNLATNLKNFSRKYKVSIDTWTQTNNDYKNEANRDSSVIRGAKSIADKTDVGGVVSEPTNKEKKKLEVIASKYIKDVLGITFKDDETLKLYMPTHCISIYKNRAGQFKNIKIWLRIDYGTMRVHDLYVTDSDVSKIIVDLKKKRYIYVDKDNDSITIQDNKVAPQKMDKEFMDNIKKEVEEAEKDYFNTLDFVKKKREENVKNGITNEEDFVF